MRVRLTLRGTDGFACDVQISAPAGSDLSDVAGALGDVLPESLGATPTLWSGTRHLPSGALLGGPGLRTGDVVHVGGAGPPDLAAGAVLRLHVVGGPDAGTAVALARGLLTIGRAADCDLVLTDPDVSRRHVSITVTSTGVTVRDLDSTNGSRLDDEPVDRDGSSMRAGQLLHVGDSTICVVGADEPAAAVRPGVDGSRLVNRPPRLSVGLPDREVTMPVRPTLAGPQRIQWFAAFLPAIAGCALAMLMHNVLFLAFALMSPVMIIGSAAGDRLHRRRNRRRDAMSFRRCESEAQAARAALLAAETSHRRHAHPDPAAIRRTASIPGCRLWERRCDDPDALDVRLGLADLPATLAQRKGSETGPAGMVRCVPTITNLRRGPLGIAGPRDMALGTARWVLGQLGVLHSPADLGVALVLSDAAAPAWRWARWLPHLQGVAADADDRQSLVGTLLRQVDERLALDPRGWSGAWTVLVVDRTGALADTPGLAHLLAVGPSVGITAVCVDDEERRLPTACTAVARVTGELGTHLAIRRIGDDQLPDTVADRVSARWAEQVARHLSALVDAGAGAASVIPPSTRLLDLAGLDDPDPEAVLARWHDGGAPVTVLGAGLDGAFTVDLVRDGPHTLIAGTTGAGKSELLQTLVAGLAMANSPQQMSFVLIDYKGGAAFADCADLPHTAGLVTDLDPHLTRRALQSLHAELRRRETLLSAAGAKDLDAYRRSPRSEDAPLGRLLLVVDEFASLAEELPDFVAGLVGVAQRGRSLGVHLVLATQRPGGVISPEIRANTTLRIALRVTDPGESADVIGTDVAAAIDKRRPGRAFVRTGSALTEIQTARVGGSAPIGEDVATAITLDGWARPPAAEADPATGKTDLRLLVDTMREATATSGAHSVQSPWLPPLPALLPAGRAGDDEAPTRLAIGLVDLPDVQQQPALILDLAAGGPTLLVGGPRSGRTSILRTMALRAASRLAPRDLHLYALDCAGGALRSLAQLPHCAGVMTRDDFPTVERLIARLTAEIARRQAFLAERGVTSLREARACGAELPYVVMILDGWEAFAAGSEEHDAGRSIDAVLGMLRDAATVGVTVVLTGDRAALAARVAGNVGCKYILRLADRGDYALAGLSPRAVPDSMPPGRAVRADDGAEVQFGFLGADPGPDAQRQVLDGVVHAAASEPGPGPAPLRALPTSTRFDALGPVRPQWTIVGVGGDTAGPVPLDLFAGDARWIVAGPPRSGRTTTLHLLLRQAVAKGVDTLVAAPRRSPLIDAAGSYAVSTIGPDDDPAAARHGTDGPRLVIVDDVEAFLDTPIGDALEALAHRPPADTSIVLSGRTEDLALTYRGVAAAVRRSRQGILLNPGPGDGDLLGLRLPRARQVTLAGRGVLVADQPQLHGLGGAAGVIPIQVPLP